MASGKLFGSEVFDPKFIILQIWLLQSFFYSINLVLLSLFNKFFGLQPSLSQLFSDESLKVQDAYCLVFILSGLVSLPFMCCAIVYVVERTHKVLDFGLTVYFFHFVLVSIYSGVPFNLVWWITNGVFASLTVILSEYVCLKIEQQEITLNFGNNKVS
jgi:hypothetical protein